MAVNKVEELKNAKHPFDAYPELMRAAEQGFETIQAEDFTRFRWFGIYQQKPNEGHFMMRTKLPNGIYNANQLRTMAGIARDFGRGIADITTRQNFQFHWITVQDLPEIFRRLHAVGITTLGACGDITRNVVGCPVAGIDADEIIDASPLGRRISDYMLGNREFANLPRKYKISLSGCRLHCAQPDINCVGIYGAERPGVGGTKEAGFGIKIGGGLSTKPYFGADLGVFLRPDEVFAVVVAVTEIFRDAEVLRENRGKARLKFLVHDPKIGIGIAKVREVIETKIGYRLTDGGPFDIPKVSELDHLGIRPQKQPGKYYVGIGVTVGRQSADTLDRIADLADEFSAERQIRNTNKQNFIVAHIPEDRLGKLQERLRESKLDYEPSIFKKGFVSCTGIEFCNLAVTETKEFGRRLADSLEERFPGATRQVRIHMSGCPNQCGQTPIGDIGLRGGLTKIEGESKECYDMMVGGSTGSGRAFAETCTRKVLKDQVLDHIARLYEGYLTWASNGETFGDYVKAHSLEELGAVARGGAVATAPAGDDE